MAITLKQKIATLFAFYSPIICPWAVNEDQLHGHDLQVKSVAGARSG